MENSIDNLEKFKLLDIDIQKSIKSNFLICLENFKRLGFVFEKLNKFFEEIKKKLNPDEITKQVQSNVINNKISLTITPSFLINSPITQPSRQYTFVINRLSPQSFEIRQNANDENKLNFDLSNVVCKQLISGIISYPVVQTDEEKILITFSNLINESYKIIIS